MSESQKHHEPTESELAEIKARLKAGKLEKKDIAALEGLVQRTERAARQLRAAIVE